MATIATIGILPRTCPHLGKMDIRLDTASPSSLIPRPVHSVPMKSLGHRLYLHPANLLSCLDDFSVHQLFLKHALIVSVPHLPASRLPSCSNPWTL